MNGCRNWGRERRPKADFTKYAESQKEGMAQFYHVPVEKVRVISRDEYEENTD